ncbi:MAG: hypothetical protein JWO92_977 [Chitinophagaceae bacterium]|nr:hypothetical protein [Chitinophagaceae bacterium]MDB5222746.1 hypothetical protein [Chitinophagaceae bacterium]
MKIALFGNICNNMYNIAKALRADPNLDVHLYLEDPLDIQNKPESDNPELKDNYPDWIQQDKKFSPLLFIKKKDKTFIRELNKYDIVILSHIGIILTPFLKGKTVFYVTGGDVTRIPFPVKFSFLYKSIKHKLTAYILGYYQRRGIKHADEIWTQPFSPYVNALNKIKVKPGRIKNVYFPVIIDTGIIRYKPDYLSRINKTIQYQLAPFKFLIFHPSRMMIRKNEALMASGQWKQNEILFYGLALFLKKYPQLKDVCIMMPDRAHSNDKDIAKKIITDLGIEENIVWIKGETNEGFTKSEMVDLYSMSNLVVDEFGIGWFGSIVLEGMACSKPVICNIDEKVMKQLYEWHPVISVNTPEAVCDIIYKLYIDHEYSRELGEKGREWILQYHSPANVSTKYITQLQQLLK